MAMDEPWAYLGLDDPRHLLANWVENKHEDMSHGNCVQGTQSTPLIIAAIAVTADPHLWNIVAQAVAAAV